MLLLFCMSCVLWLSRALQRYVENVKEVTFVQSTKGRECGILRLLESLPRADGSLQRVHVFPSRDGTLAIYLFGYVRQEDVLPGLLPAGGGDGNNPSASAAAAAGFLPAEAIPPSDTKAGKARRAAAVATLSASGPSSELLEYAASLQAGEWVDNAAHAPPGPMFEPAAMLEYLSRCEPEFVQHSHPRRFCKHRVLYEVGGWVVGKDRGGEGKRRGGCLVFVFCGARGHEVGQQEREEEEQERRGVRARGWVRLAETDTETENNKRGARLHGRYIETPMVNLYLPLASAPGSYHDLASTNSPAATTSPVQYYETRR